MLLFIENFYKVLFVFIVYFAIEKYYETLKKRMVNNKCLKQDPMECIMSLPSSGYRYA